MLKWINTKDKLYKTLAKTDSQSVIYQTLKRDFEQIQNARLEWRKKCVFTEHLICTKVISRKHG